METALSTESLLAKTMYAALYKMFEVQVNDIYLDC